MGRPHKESIVKSFEAKVTTAEVMNTDFKDMLHFVKTFFVRITEKLTQHKIKQFKVDLNDQENKYPVFKLFIEILHKKGYCQKY